MLPEKRADVTYNNGQILRNDDLYYLTGEFDLTKSLSVRVQGYHHKDKGAGNNWIFGLSNQGTASTADDIPVQIRDTRYTIDRTGALGSVAWDLGFNRLEAGLWYETNTSSAARYIWTSVRPRSAWRSSWRASPRPPNGCRRPAGRRGNSMSRTRSSCSTTR
ncbi:MAG: hypothetical protein WDN24_15375 [Sphingomonas sp.]